jgi:hypothetical protein
LQLDPDEAARKQRKPVLDRAAKPDLKLPAHAAPVSSVVSQTALPSQRARDIAGSRVELGRRARRAAYLR